MSAADVQAATIEGIDLDAVVPCLADGCPTGAVWAARCPACPREVTVCDHHRTAVDLAATMLREKYPTTQCAGCNTWTPTEFDWRSL